jgi:hypothetical protein
VHLPRSPVAVGYDGKIDVKQGFKNDRPLIFDKLKRQFSGVVDIRYKENNQVDLKILPGVLEGGKFRRFDSVVLERISVGLPAYEKYDPRLPEFTAVAIKVFAENELG